MVLKKEMLADWKKLDGFLETSFYISDLGGTVTDGEPPARPALSLIKAQELGPPVQGSTHLVGCQSAGSDLVRLWFLRVSYAAPSPKQKFNLGNEIKFTCRTSPRCWRTNTIQTPIQPWASLVKSHNLSNCRSA